MRHSSRLELSCLVMLVAVTVPAMAQAPQSSNFNRTKTVRREVMAGPARAGQGTGAVAQSTLPRGVAGDPLHPYTTRSPGPAASTRSLSSGAPASPRAPQPMSLQEKSTPHAFYPGMRTSQGPNHNVASQSRRKSGRTGLLPGMMIPGGGMMMPGGMLPGGMMGPAPSFSPAGK